MRRMWALGAAMSVCLVFGGRPALAQEGEPSASLPPPDGSSILTLEVSDLAGMEGLEVGADLLGESGGWGPNLLRQMVQRDDATVTASHVLEPGRYFLVVYAGKPPCEVRFAPWCGGGEAGSWVSRVRLLDPVRSRARRGHRSGHRRVAHV